jgi:ribose 5-phosphate isomerase B
MVNITESELQMLVHKVVEERLKTSTSQPSPIPSPDIVASNKKIVAIGSDHGGFALKEALKPFIQDLGFDMIDCGPNDKSAVDYPDFAHSVAQLVSTKKVWRGIMIDGAGIGSCMVANKVPGVRASLCYDLSTASNAREHNDANYLTLGAGLIGENLAKQIVKTWLSTEFGGGRHAGRVEKINAIEKQYFK